MCRFCEGECAEYSSATIFSHKGVYFKCGVCGSLQVSNPFWLADAHTDGVHNSDVGLVQRSINVSRLIGTVLALNGHIGSNGIDWGGGTGLLTRLLRDQGFQCLSYDKYASQQLASGFIASDFELQSKKTFVTTIECIEHLEDPIGTLTQVVSNADLFIFTVEVLPAPTPNPASERPWFYFEPSAGQHITFPSKVGLDLYCKKLGFNFYTKIESLHIFSREKIRFSLRVIVKFPKVMKIVAFLIQRYNYRHSQLGTKDAEFLKRAL
jgi:hypothetical protein